MPQKMQEYFYQGDSSDLEELMYNVGGWAQNWADVLWYLQTVAPHNLAFTHLDRTALVGYVERLQRNGARFTTDYREMYRELTGRECTACAPPNEARIKRAPLRKIAEKWLVGLQFPADKDDIVERAKATHAPVEILNVLKGLAKPRYRNMGVLLHEIASTHGSIVEA